MGFKDIYILALSDDHWKTILYTKYFKIVLKLFIDHNDNAHSYAASRSPVCLET